MGWLFMKRAGTGLIAGLLCIGLLLPAGNAARAEDTALTEDTTLTEADKAFFAAIDGEYGSLTRVTRTKGSIMRRDGTQEGFAFEGNCYPVRDLFGPEVESIDWDNKRKIAFIRNQGKELILNFGSGSFTPDVHQVVMPKEWICFEDGKSKISLSFLNGVFSIYPFVDQEIEKTRQEWKERLAFLGIRAANGVTDHKSMIHHVDLYFTEKY